ncbi:hypothetical protein LTR37_002994 [Vermiconidia calcicola]|uniref:Uncharacterized protein n=1 Tax=Vermiconidia calcicola TaxID=1690605 RepID=A0ACC3NTA2_9PEZI|nr:hypothetical protein LTR37_002994 [Vermiconidia calcicola]
MLEDESPTSLHSTDSGIAQHILRPPSRNHSEDHRPSYRLFPTVEATPPVSPLSLQQKTLTKVAETHRKRSISLDDTARTAAARQNVTLRTVAVKRGRKVSVTDVTPMSTVQESPVQSPSYSVLPRSSDDASHSRSASVPGDYVRDSQTPPVKIDVNAKPAWSSKQATSHPFAQPRGQPRGLGLSLTPSNLSKRLSHRQGPTRLRPNLTIEVKKETRPPPPPPKSPRHSTNSSSSTAVSAVSAVSSVHGDSPPSATASTPGSLPRTGRIDTPIQTPATVVAKQQSFFPPQGALRVREVIISTEKNGPPDPTGPTLPTQSTDRPTHQKPKAIDLDKPMPSLPLPSLPSSSFSDHVREVREVEGTDQREQNMAIPTHIVSQSPEATHKALVSQAEHTGHSVKESSSSEFKPPVPSLNDLARSQEAPVEPSRLSESALKDHKTITTRESRSPVAESGNRPQSLANLLHTAKADTKVLPVLPTEGGPRPRSATPDGGPPFSKASDPHSGDADPSKTLRDLNKQVEALHARYATLRADRLRLSTAISMSLRADKPGPDYANVLLDQHLTLNAINSSMDICFAKLKSLDCRKEEAVAALLANMKVKSALECARHSGSAKMHLSPALAASSGRSTPEYAAEPKALIPETSRTSKMSPMITPASTPSTPSPTLPQQGDGSVLKGTTDSEKRNTVIKASPAEALNTDSNPPLSPMSTNSGISSLEEERHNLRRIRIKGAKAAKILGLVAQPGTGNSESPGITLPEEAPPKHLHNQKPAEAEAESQSKQKTGEKVKSPLQPAPGTAPPKRKPPPPPRQNTSESLSSVAATSVSSSPPDEHEATTPRSQDVPFGLNGAKRGILQSIQVFVDDDILEYYKGNGW